MSEQEPQISDEEAQAQIQSMMLALDAIYNLHCPKDTKADEWVCNECTTCDGDVAWPCNTEQIILAALGLTNETIEKTPAE